jgi:hypothetical protein
VNAIPGMIPNAVGVFIAQLLAPHRERLSRLFDQTLDVIENAFQAREIFLVRGVVVDGGADHYARLEAVKMFMQLISSRKWQAIRCVSLSLFQRRYASAQIVELLLHWQLGLFLVIDLGENITLHGLHLRWIDFYSFPAR